MKIGEYRQQNEKNLKKVTEKLGGFKNKIILVL